ncbi:MAG TPA: signal peptidase I [Candidatus Dormibacteraeota bacterium]|nr:signal peptidase I [Candidatus Dormibacteraeota bacterium]
MLPDDAPKTIVRDYFETIVTCVIFVIFARTFAFQQSKIPTGSMIPTLLVGDYIMVNKFAFAPLSSVPALAWVEHLLLPVRDLKRKDIVVFKYPEEPEKDYIKRVIGLPGEVLEVRSRVVYIDGKPLEEPYVIHRNPPGLNSDQDNYPPTRIPENSLFCMGDNRDNSKDSRSWGFVPRDYVKGRAFMIWWSYDEDSYAWQKTALADKASGIWDKITHLFTKSRWERSFKIIK